ncbi:hypothetical protein AURDEDRAFT_178047 [Auricularia subglabra TFB-10046 SS5]|uniref:Major facilitator superfamily (MFS) profile domain-containing protein n=1 Tax=Auricularia subglabra (strain TFB-10046 / SS5) TaxID=717982 RepID=J0CRG8_AURST|nr:hypothetical protein AURDEDRAFT_178047 [Auricularia subglabra TFB-10046 SS5]
MSYRQFIKMLANTAICAGDAPRPIDTFKMQARAFSLFQFAAYVGLFIGPLIGGALVTPTEQFPGCSLTAVFAFANLLWLNETLPDQTSDSSKQVPPSMKQIFASPAVIPVLINFLYCFLLNFLTTTRAYTARNLATQSSGISFFVTLIGVLQACWLLFVFPPL